jgi:hypothetical protein
VKRHADGLHMWGVQWEASGFGWHSATPARFARPAGAGEAMGSGEAVLMVGLHMTERERERERRRDLATGMWAKRSKGQIR